MELIGAIAIMIGIIAGAVQVLDYLEKRREKKAGPNAPKTPIQSPPQPATRKELQNGKRHNLPSQLTSLVGRNQETSTAESLLRNSGVRLLTLTGPGGIGKTRLCLQVAHNLIDDFEDGVFFVALASLREHSLVVPAIAQTLEVSEAGDQSVSERLIDYLREKQVLLVLDSFEQLVGAAPQLTELLAQCPQLRLLVTSRAVLRLTGEHELEVPPLATPDLQHLLPIDGLAQCEAMQLFVERAQVVKPDFTLTDENAQSAAEICVRLDGLPLAIELAAARIKFLRPSAILTRLDDRFALLTTGMRDMPQRHQTLEATIAWSYELLDEWEQILFAKLSVFVGGFTLEAADAVVAATDENEEIFDELASLVDKSMLKQHEQTSGELRFWMLETIREYGKRCLRTSRDAEKIQRQHAEFFLGLAEQAEPNLLEEDQLVWLDHLEQEHGNLRTALEWFISHEQEEKSLRMVGALGLFWAIRGYLTEGQMWLTKVLAGSISDSKTARAKALRMAAVILPVQGDYTQAKMLHEESLALSKELGDKLGMALTLNYFGNISRQQGDYERAKAMSEEALSLCTELEYESGIAWSLNYLASVAFNQGELDRAAMLLEDSLTLFRELEDSRGISATLEELGSVAKYQGAYDQATLLYQESLILSEKIGNKLRIAIALAHLGEIALFQGSCGESEALCKQALKSFQDLGGKRGIGRVLILLGNIASSSGEYGQAIRLHKESLAIVVAIEDKKYISKNLLGLGKAMGMQGQMEEAVKLLAAGSSILDNIGTVLTPFDRAEFERSLGFLQARLDQQAFASAWSKGCAMTLENAVEFVAALPLEDSRKHEENVGNTVGL